ncbi:MAG TPA: M66 family metalloprotease [Polyangiaceae bacterium]|nr:M66 family metalloprotease [Polyangiaceae bacterium]
MNKSMIGLALVASTLGACSAEIGSEYDETSEEIYASTNKLWPSPRHSERTTIGVCFDNEVGRTKERGWVKDAVLSSWGAATKIDFKGFGSCRSTGHDITIIGGITENIKIHIADEGARVTGGLGSTMDKMILNFTFKNWSSSCSTGGEAVRENCIRDTAVHEFGHALGLAHEQNRSDSPCDREQGSYGDTFWTYDTDSVMNYCAGWKHVLSPLDREGIRMLYGGRGTFGNGYYALWNHSTKVFNYLGTKRQSTDMEIKGDTAVRNAARIQIIRLNTTSPNGRLAFGDRIQLKASVVTNGKAWYIGPGGATRTAFTWTIGRTDGTTTAGAVDIRVPFVLTGLGSDGTTSYLVPGGSSKTHGERAEWRLLAGM